MASTYSGSVSNELEGYGSTSKLITAATSLSVKQKTLNLPVWSHGRFAPVLP